MYVLLKTESPYSTRFKAVVDTKTKRELNKLSLSDFYSVITAI